MKIDNFLKAALIRKVSQNYKKMWKFTFTQKNNEFPANLDVNNLGGWKFDTKKRFPIIYDCYSRQSTHKTVLAKCSQLSPCGHSTITDTLLLITEATSRAETTKKCMEAEL